MKMDFEWHDNKNERNIQKHGVDFVYAVTIFADPHRLQKEDTRKDYGEVRYITIGSIENLIYVVVYTIREQCYRIISARRANYEERQAYDYFFESKSSH